MRVPRVRPGSTDIHAALPSDRVVRGLTQAARYGMGDGNAEFIVRFMGANGDGDFDEVGRCLHPDMVMEWPQSGERFVGRENALGAMRAQERMPAMGGEPGIVGSGDVWVVMVPLLYGDDTYHYVAVLELADGLVRRGTGFWGAPFPAQASRAPFAEG